MIRSSGVVRFLVGALPLLSALVLMGSMMKAAGPPANAPHGPMFGRYPELYVHGGDLVGVATGVKARVTVLGLGLVPDIDYDLGVGVPHSDGCCQTFWHAHSDRWGRVTFHFPLGAVPLTGSSKTPRGEAVILLAAYPAPSACVKTTKCARPTGSEAIGEFIGEFPPGP